ncbi:potassium channel family protein [Limisalsivibrio acetivorans]|uniref:potassium channel family protein n=1 Tax=Limisalsivibrio acetivorans TaxID=1304888 RepID=UPI0003B527E2|nr:potassium channel protein [Limisalsivibrio acetivorans]
MRKVDSTRFIYIATFLMIGTILTGTVGYAVVEGASPLDALYMTIITVTTVGYGEVIPLSNEGKTFTIVLILLGTGTLAYTATQIMDYIVAGELGKIFVRRRMSIEISKLKDHYIVCGYGRMGKTICESLYKSGVPFVIIDIGEDRIEEMTENRYLYIHGDATKEDSLIDAGITDAKGLITVVDSDVKNVYIVLTAKGLAKELYVVAKSSDEEAYSKLFWAGADRVVSPYIIGGLSIANSVTKPHVHEFMDLALGHGNYGIEVEEVVLKENSDMTNKKLSESKIRNVGIIVIAVRRANGAFIYNPGSDTVLKAKDTLIALGRKEDFEALQKMIG